MMKVTIAEDDAAQLAAMEGYVRRYAAERGCDMTVRTFTNGVDLITDHTNDCDILFIDIQMPLLDGISASERLRAEDGEVRIVFVTNLAAHAIDGYKVGAMDFLVKPVTYGDVAFELDKVAADKRSDDDYVWLGSSGSVRKVLVRDIRFLRNDGHNILISLVRGEVRVRGSLGDFEQRLAGKGFSRCDHCALVNLRYVESVAGDEITLAGGGTLFVSRRKKKNFNDDLMRYIAEGRATSLGSGLKREGRKGV